MVQMNVGIKRTGDIGTVVACYGNDSCEVEFMTTGGDTISVVTLSNKDIRSTEKKEILHVRDVTEMIA